MKKNEESQRKKPRPNKYQVAAAIGKAGKEYILPIVTGLCGIAITVVVKDKIKTKK